MAGFNQLSKKNLIFSKKKNQNQKNSKKCKKNASKASCWVPLT
jgi:hypothetical protein